MTLRRLFGLFCINVGCLFLASKMAYPVRFEPPENTEEIRSLQSTPVGLRVLNKLGIKEEPDYSGRRFTSINVAGTHHILKSRLFRGGYALYKIALDTPPSHHVIVKGKTYTIGGPGMFVRSTIFLGKERTSDTGATLTPELIREVKTLNDISGFVDIRNKKDAVEYVRLGSSDLTASYFLPYMKEIFCASDDVSEPDVLAETECKRLGLDSPRVKTSHGTKIKIESDESGKRKRLKIDSTKSDDHEEDDGEGEDANNRSKSFLVTRNVVSHRDGAIYRIIEEVGKMGEWKVVEKKQLHSMTLELRRLLSHRNM